MYLLDEAQRIALQFVVSLLEPQATHDAAVRAHLAVLRPMLLRVDEEPSPPIAEVVVDDQHAIAFAPATGTTPPVDQPISTPTPTSLPATHEDIEQLARFFNGEMPPDPDPVVVKHSTKHSVATLTDEVELLAQLSTNCARCAMQVREMTANFPAPTTNLDPWFAKIRTPEAQDPAVWAALGAAFDQVAVGAEILVEIVNDPELNTYQLPVLYQLPMSTPH